MPTTNHNITFARMRTDVQRLLVLARTDELRASLKVLLNVYDKIEHKFDDQPAAMKPTKKAKVDPNKIMPFSIGYADYMNGRVRTDTTNNKNNDPEWYRGYDAAHTKEPERNPQPHTHTEEQPE